MAARSRFVSEDEADEVLQMSYTKRKSGKVKGLIYIIMVVIGAVLGFLAPFAMGAQTDPFYFPIWPLLVFLFAFLLVAAAVAMVLNYRIVSTAYDDFERKNYIKRFSNRSLIILAVGAVFMVLFISMLFPSNSWIEGVVEQNYGTYDQAVSGWSAGDFRFTPNDPMDLTTASLKVEVQGNYSVHIFVGELAVFKAIEDVENITEVEGKSLSGAFQYNTTKFDYDGGSFEPGTEYVIRVYNYENVDDINLKIYVVRDVSDLLLWSMFGICLGFVIVGGVSFGLMAAAKKQKVRAKVAAPAEGRGRARDAATMFKDMEGEVDAMFATEGTGYREGRVPAGRGGRRPAPQGARAAPRRSPAAAATAADMERPRGTKKTISCPRCRTRFSYTKIEGEVTEIKCPNCGKRGRVGAKKKAPPRPAPTPTPRPRPAAATPKPTRRPPKPAGRPKPTKTASPLDEVMGAPAAAPPKKKTLACPGCKKKFQVMEKPRPFKIECPHCGKTGMLR